MSTRRLSFTGRWQTTFGPMDLREFDGRVEGVYANNSRIEGEVVGNELIFDYYEPVGEFQYAQTPTVSSAEYIHGEGRFMLSPDGMTFAGFWLQDGAPQWALWVGQREELIESDAHRSSMFRSLN
ncbi:MAG: hypothetical protein ACFCD0_22305 [Gemmataceae bacterium]